MNTYIKKVIVLTNEERNILRSAAEIIGKLYAETDDSDFNRAENILIDTYCEGAFDVEINE